MFVCTILFLRTTRNQTAKFISTKDKNSQEKHQSTVVTVFATVTKKYTWLDQFVNGKQILIACSKGSSCMAVAAYDI